MLTNPTCEQWDEADHEAQVQKLAVIEEIRAEWTAEGVNIRETDAGEDTAHWTDAEWKQHEEDALGIAAAFRIADRECAAFFERFATPAE